MDEHGLIKARQRQREFTRRAAAAARKAGGPELTEDEIVEAVKTTRAPVSAGSLIEKGEAIGPRCPDHH